MSNIARKILLLILSLFVSSSIFSDYSTSMFPIMNKSEGIVKMIENDLNMEIVRIEYDILSTSKSTIRTLTNGWTYMIVAFGDFRFRDIDIKVYRYVNGYWQLIEKDMDAESVAAVSITPSYTEEYKIEISAYSFESDYNVGHYGLIIAH